MKIETGVKEKAGFEWRKILEWCNSHSEIPEDDDEVFCVDIDYDIVRVKGRDILKHFRIFCTTKRLISLALIKSNKKLTHFNPKINTNFIIVSSITTYNNRWHI